MTVFVEYARYYDLLYKDKPYEEEVAYILRVLKNHAPQAKKLLELGCGSGVHAAYLAQAGFNVDGIDQSDWMLTSAYQRREKLPLAVANRLQFHKGDVRDIRLNFMVDAVISLFHVVSYQTTDSDVRAIFETAFLHLSPGGVFFFDVWYGPAVLKERPARRVKELEDNEFKIVRIATPILHANRHIVDVHYELTAYDKKKNTVSKMEEMHRMRYFTTPELEGFASDSGFVVQESHAWMTQEEPSEHTWGVSFICRKQ